VPAPAIALVPSDGTFRWGDVNADGIAGTLDAAQILQWVVAPPNPVPPEADVDHSLPSGITALDASRVLQHRVGSIDRFPADTNGDGFGPDAKALVTTKSLAVPVPRTLRIETTASDTGETVEATVLFDEASNILAYEFELAFDDTIVELDSVRSGALTRGWGDPVHTTEPGYAYVVAAGAEPLDGEGELLVLRFRALDSDLLEAGHSWLDITAASVNAGDDPIFVEE